MRENIFIGSVEKLRREVWNLYCLLFLCFGLAMRMYWYAAPTLDAWAFPDIGKAVALAKVVCLGLGLFLGSRRHANASARRVALGLVSSGALLSVLVLMMGLSKPGSPATWAVVGACAWVAVALLSIGAMMRYHRLASILQG